MKSEAIRAGLAVLVFSVGGTVRAQTLLPVHTPALPTASAKPQAAIALNVIALNGSGNPVPGLAAADFIVMEDGKPLVPADFAQPDASGPGATEAILLLDAVNTGFSSVGYVRGELTRFLKENGGKLPLPVSLAVLQETSFTVSGSPSTDGETVLTELDGKNTGLRAVGRSAGFYGADERLQISLRALQQLALRERGRPGRKQVLWLSPGWAYFSGPRVEISDKGRQAFYAELVQLSQNLREAGIVLYAIDPRGAATAASSRNEYYKDFLKPVRSAADVVPGDLSLQALAAKSGGRVLFGSNSVSAEIAACLREASGLYTLALPPQAGESPSFHAVEIKAAKPGILVRAPSGFYTSSAPGK